MSGIDKQTLEDLTPEELDAQKADALPNREVMSLITPNASMLAGYASMPEGSGAAGATPNAGDSTTTTPSTPGPVQELIGSNADASATQPDLNSSGDQTLQTSASDSASAT